MNWWRLFPLSPTLIRSVNLQSKTCLRRWAPSIPKKIAPKWTTAVFEHFERHELRRRERSVQIGNFAFTAPRLGHVLEDPTNNNPCKSWQGAGVPWDFHSMHGAGGGSLEMQQRKIHRQISRHFGGITSCSSSEMYTVHWGLRFRHCPLGSVKHPGIKDFLWNHKPIFRCRYKNQSQVCNPKVTSRCPDTSWLPTWSPRKWRSPLSRTRGHSGV